MKTVLVILIFIIFCYVAFVIGYRAGYSDGCEDNILEEFGDEIQKGVEKII